MDLSPDRHGRFRAEGMAGCHHSVPRSQAFRTTGLGGPVAERTGSDAWQARSAYPRVAFAGAVFDVARGEAGWETMSWQTW
jgi:Family of unknown function (DUF5954)